MELWILNLKNDALATVGYTEGEVTSQSLWSRYNRHFVGMTRHNALN